ncbi:MAG: hypothetical protein WCI46_15525 [Verrucomicrobiota bacterium]
MDNPSDIEEQGGAASIYQGYNLVDPHVVAMQSGDTDMASGLGTMPTTPNPYVGMNKPSNTSNFVITEGSNNSFTYNDGNNVESPTASE